MDRFTTPSECWEQAAFCRTRADAAADERLRAVWTSMALIWTKLAAHKGTASALECSGAQVTPLQKPKSRLEAHAPQCARCKALSGGDPGGAPLHHGEQTAGGELT